MRSWSQSTKSTKDESCSEVKLKKSTQDRMLYSQKGSSPSRMTVAKVMDVIPRLPDCAGQVADAVSACAQVRMEDAPKLLKNSKVRMSRYLDTSTKAQMAKVMVQYGRPSRSS